MKTLIRPLSATPLGLIAAVLVSCGSSNTGLIPAESGGPLQKDFEAVAQTAAAGNGNCATTESTLGKTDQDFLALPATIDKGLHKRLEEGISNLRKRALEMCTQLAPTATSTTNTETTPTVTTPTTTETTPAATSTTPTTPTNPETTPTTTTQNPGGGTEAPGEGASEAEEAKGKDKAEGLGNPGGASAGGGQ